MYCVGDAPKTDKDLCAAALILAYDMEDDSAADLLGEFFQVEDQASYDALKSRTSASRTELMRRIIWNSDLMQIYSGISAHPLVKPAA